MSVEKIISDPLPDNVLALKVKGHRREVEREFATRSCGAEQVEVMLLRQDLAAARAQMEVNAAEMQRLKAVLADADLLCSCCGLEFKAVDGAVIGRSNYCCELCIDEVEERDREELAEQAEADRLMDLQREAVRS